MPPGFGPENRDRALRIQSATLIGPEDVMAAHSSVQLTHQKDAAAEACSGIDRTASPHRRAGVVMKAQGNKRASDRAFDSRGDGRESASTPAWQTT